MPAPLEVFATGATEVYLAPTGTADPAINVAVPGTYILVGVAGSKDYSEDGVRWRKGTENTDIYTNGQYGVRKVFRNRERLIIAMNVLDATLEAYRDAFNQSVVTTLVGPPAEKTIPLAENATTPTFRTMLLRAPNSPYMDGGVLQLWIPLVYQTGETETIYRKSEPVGLAMEFTAVFDTTNGFGKMHGQTA
jgi:hypothetical protein